MEFTDQTGHQLELNSIPERIISLVPSQTELLYDLGLDDRVVGITKFCIHPQTWFETKARVGGTKALKLDKIRELQPDLILANREENTRHEIEYLRQHYPVYTSDICSLSDSLEMIRAVGQLTDTGQRAHELVQTINQAFDGLRLYQGGRKRVVYLIWQDPVMAVGKQTFIDDMLGRCGFINVVEQERYPELGVADLQRLSPDILLLASEPFPFREKHVVVWQGELPDTQPVLVDGEYFSWYGSRLQKAPGYFVDLINKIS
ncbi:MAG: ABC transporter substrate-binding protein [Flavobacteriales bacterium]|nr:ABC transporter substrate-binding protein [Flavobacteriales bacterium]